MCINSDLMQVAIQFVIYCHYMLTSCMECLWNIKPLFEGRLVNRANK